MDWQQITALAIVAVTAAAFAYQRLQRRKFNWQRDTHCGCSSAGGAKSSSIIFHAKKGEKPQMIVKMK
jgi:hypothetical protein